MKKIYMAVLLLSCCHILHGQNNGEASQQPMNLRGLKECYPIGDLPDINFRTPFSDYEKPVLFEANPIVRYSFYNNIRTLMDDPGSNRGNAGYVAFKPQIRMYTEPSVPVKTPSYRIEFGYQRVWELPRLATANNYFTIGIESGHYSNGQSGGAFDSLHDDHSIPSDSIIRSINNNSNLAKMLNRKSGNFSTDLTSLSLNYRSYRGYHLIKHAHSATINFTYFHDRFFFILPFGGPTLPEEFNIFGRYRISAQYEYTHIIESHCTDCPPKRISISQKLEYVGDAQASIAPWRSESRLSYFFGSISKYNYRYNPPTGDFGIYLAFVAGHDTYNYRIVDHVQQFILGFCWDIAPISHYVKCLDGNVHSHHSDTEKNNEPQEGHGN